MAALLKALGVTIWSLAAVGLLLLAVAAGFKMVRRAPLGTSVAQAPERAPAHAGSPQSAGAERDRPAKDVSSAASGPVPQSVDPRISAAFRAALARNDPQHIIQFGIQLDAIEPVSAADLGRIALAFFTIGDCASAQKFLHRSAPLAGNAQEWPAPLNWIATGCNYPAAAPLSPPAGPTDAAGERDVHIGELYYGFNDYARAVVYLQKGIRAGGLRQPADAFVYLGRSYLALGQHTQACVAFDQLQQLPEVSRRVRELWALFADMHCRLPDPP